MFGDDKQAPAPLPMTIVWVGELWSGLARVVRLLCDLASEENKKKQLGGPGVVIARAFCRKTHKSGDAGAFLALQLQRFIRRSLLSPGFFGPARFTNNKQLKRGAI